MAGPEASRKWTRRSQQRCRLAVQAVDTNVVVRYLAADHPAQSARARALIDRQDVWIGLTVLLEAEWVLRGSYRLPVAAILSAFRTLLGQSTVHVENTVAVSRAFSLVEAGMDFADALHLAAAADCDGFATFDGKLIKAAARAGAGHVHAL